MGGDAGERGGDRRGLRRGRAQGSARRCCQKGRLGRRRRLAGAPGRGTLEKDKPPILGLIQRGGQVVLRMLANVQQTTIQPIIEATVAKGALIHTDEYGIYARLPTWGYWHKTVCHGRGEYARDEDGDGFCEVHVNTIEGFWSLLRSCALLAPPASGHLAGEAAGLPRLLPVRAQRAPPGQSPPRRLHRGPRRLTARHHPGTRQEPRERFFGHHQPPAACRARFVNSGLDLSVGTHMRCYTQN